RGSRCLALARRTASTSCRLQYFGELAEDDSPALGEGAARVAAGQGAGRLQLRVAEPLPAAMLDRDPGQRRAELREGQLDLGGRWRDQPGHAEPRRWLP